MPALFLLMAAASCADPGFCPARREFVTAVADHDDQRLWELNAAANANSEQLTLIMQHRIQHISRIACGKPEATPRAVICTAFYDYGSGPKLRTFRFTRTGETWHAEGDTP